MSEDRRIEFENLKNNNLTKIKSIKQRIKNIDYTRVRCDICKIDIQIAFNRRHFKSKKHFEYNTQNKEVIPGKNSIKRVVQEEIKVSDIDIKDENLYHFTDKTLKVALNITIDNHHSKHANSTMIFTSKFDDIGIDITYINQILVERVIIYAKLINQNKFKYQITFSSVFNKYGEDGEITNQIEIPNIVSMTHILTQSELDNIIVQWTLENRIQTIEMKESGWNFQKTNSRKIGFYTTGGLIRSSYVKIPLRSSAIVNIRNDDKDCFLWAILAKLHPGNNDHPNRVSNYNNFSMK